MEISLAKEKVLSKFGFRIDHRGYYVHKKLDVELNGDQLQNISSVEDLEDYIKSLLRTS